MVNILVLLVSLIIFVFVYFKLTQRHFDSKRECGANNTCVFGDGVMQQNDEKELKASVSKQRDVNWSALKGRLKSNGGRIINNLARAKTKIKSKFSRRQGELSPVSSSQLRGVLSTHVEQPLENLHLSDEKIAVVRTEYSKSILHTPGLHERARRVNFPVSEHLLYRYYESCDWSDEFYGKGIAEAVVESILWREEFGTNNIDVEPLRKMVESGFIYVSGLDAANRPVLYFKIANNKHKETTDVYLDLLMHSVEKANTLSERKDVASGEFVGIIDLKGLTFETLPPIATLKMAVGLLKRHYPYRLHTLFIVNSGIVFTTVWKLLKPVVPQRAQAKIKILTAPEIQHVLVPLVGKNNLEMDYGGTLPVGTDIKTYF